MTKTKSQQALAAAQIRKILKAAYPATKFRVTSQSFAGGDSVYIDYQNGPPSSTIQRLTAPFQYGHFNGMDDSYEYTNCRDDIPQTKYVTVHREITADIYQKAFDITKNYFGDFEHVNDIDQYYAKLRGTAREYLYRYLCNLDLSDELTLETFRRVI